jgi:hypothetical protein
MTLPASQLVSNASLAANHAEHAAKTLPEMLLASGKSALTVLPGVLMASSVATSAYLVRQLPGMTALSPLILAILIGTAFHNLVGTPVLAKSGVSFSMRRLLRFGIILLGFQLTTSSSSPPRWRRPSSSPSGWEGCWASNASSPN